MPFHSLGSAEYTEYTEYLGYWVLVNDRMIDDRLVDDRVDLLAGTARFCSVFGVDGRGCRVSVG